MHAINTDKTETEIYTRIFMLIVAQKLSPIDASHKPRGGKLFSCPEKL